MEHNSYLFDFYKEGKLSQKALTVCKIVGIIDLKQLARFIYNKGNFMAITGCSLAINYELLKFHSLYYIRKRNINNNSENLSSPCEQKSPDSALEKLVNLNKISIRAYNICVAVGLKNLSDLNNFFLNKGDFLAIRNSGEKTKMELEKLSREYSSNKVESNHIVSEYDEPIANTYSSNSNEVHNKDTSLLELLHDEKLTVRAFNLCKAYKLDTIKDVVAFIRLGGDFNRARGCGIKTANEINTLVKQRESTEADWENEIISKPNFVCPKDDRKFNKYLSNNFYKLNTRAQNALLAIFEGNLPTLQQFTETFIEQKFRLIDQKNIGSKTFSELTSFIDDCKDYCNSIVKEELSEDERILTELEEVTGINKIDIKLVEKYKERSFPIIAFCAEHITALIGLNQKEEVIFKNLFHLNLKHLNNKELAYKLNYSPERIRQISINVLEKFSIVSKRLNSLKDYTEYNALFTEFDVVDFNSYEWNDALYSDIHSYGKTFSCTLLANLYSENAYSLTCIDRLKRPAEVFDNEKYKTIKQIQGFYLIRHLLPKKDLIAILNNFVEEAVKRREKDEIILIEKISNQGKSELRPEELSIITYLLKIELRLVVIGNHVVFKRNTPKLFFEYVSEALENLKRPSHISDICREIKRIEPNMNCAEDSIRSTVVRTKNVFISFGRSSTYGLKIWEIKHENIKGGTIRDISEEFLKGFEHPCHISAITMFVNKYRKTNEYSVLTNLKIAGDKRFSFYRNGHVGLANKIYINQKDKEQDFQEISLDELLENIFSK